MGLCISNNKRQRQNQDDQNTFNQSAQSEQDQNTQNQAQNQIQQTKAQENERQTSNNPQNLQQTQIQQQQLHNQEQSQHQILNPQQQSQQSNQNQSNQYNQRLLQQILQTQDKTQNLLNQMKNDQRKQVAEQPPPLTSYSQENHQQAQKQQIAYQQKQIMNNAPMPENKQVNVENKNIKENIIATNKKEIRDEQLEQNSCAFCFSQAGKQMGTCQHWFCDQCLQERFIDQFNGDLNQMEPIKCVCTSNIPINLIKTAYGTFKFELMFCPQKTNQNEQKSICQPSSKFECEICCQEYNLDKAINLQNCGHQFCVGCMKVQLKTKIENAQVDSTQLLCPSNGCEKSIDPGQVQNVLQEDLELLQKYVRFQIERAKAIKGETLVRCPRPSCNQPIYINLDEKAILCDKCEFDFCPRCFRLPHLNKNCDQYAQEQAEYNYQQKLKMGESVKREEEQQVFKSLGFSK